MDEAGLNPEAASPTDGSRARLSQNPGSIFFETAGVDWKFGHDFCTPLIASARARSKWNVVEHNLLI